jgi:hypothetical protein
VAAVVHLVKPVVGTREPGDMGGDGLVEGDGEEEGI